MTKLTCVSDLHGHLPLNLKGGDILIIGGDICSDGNEFVQSNWVNFKLSRWLKEQKKKFKHIVAVWGNHDFVGEHEYLLNKSDLPCHFLNNSVVEIEGLKIYGNPYSLPYGRWAFMLPDNKLRSMYESVSGEVDIIVSHGPPYGFKDLAARYFNTEDDTKWVDGEHTGSKSLTEFIMRKHPKLVVCGHIHEAYGQVKMPNDTLVVNASQMTLYYRPDNLPIEVNMIQEEAKNDSST
jgi:Icc-related predicted phosphoesterase